MARERKGEMGLGIRIGEASSDQRDGEKESKMKTWVSCRWKE